MGGLAADDPHHALGETREGPLDAAAAGVGRDGLVVEDDEVYVAGVVQLAGAELAHAENDQSRTVFGVVGVRQREFPGLVQVQQQASARGPERRLRELRERPGHPFERPDRRDVGHCGGQGGPALRDAQPHHQFPFGLPGVGRGCVIEREREGGVGSGLEQLAGERQVADQAVCEVGAVGEDVGEQRTRRIALPHGLGEDALRGPLGKIEGGLVPAVPPGRRRVPIPGRERGHDAVRPFPSHADHRIPIPLFRRPAETALFASGVKRPGRRPTPQSRQPPCRRSGSVTGGRDLPIRRRPT